MRINGIERQENRDRRTGTPHKRPTDIARTHLQNQRKRGRTARKHRLL